MTAREHRLCAEKMGPRAHFSFSPICGLKRPHLDRLLVELRDPWEARVEGQLYERRGRRRHRVAGAGRHHELEYVDRVLVTLAVLRLQIPHACLALMFDVDRSTIARAVHQIRPLLATRGFATSHGHRLRILEDVFAYADRTRLPCVLTAPKSRSDAPGHQGRVGGRSSRARRNRTPSSSPRSPDPKDGTCGLGVSDRGECMTRPPP